jgi:uncharacterized protein YjdB
VAVGTATITVKTADGGYTATCAVTVTGGSVTPCDNPVTASLPLTQNGAGEYCWVTSGTITYVNSWNMQLVEINGVDYTNKWSNSMPARIDGNYYIHYKANVAWAHLEVNGSGGGTTIPVTGVTLSPTTVSVSTGSTTILTATVSPANATNKSVTWTSSNTSVAAVSSSGVVTGVAAGTATITVKTADGGFTATCAVTVTTATVPVTGVTVSPTTVSVSEGLTTTLTATVLPANATNKSVTWTSSNTSVATVSSSGVVTGVAAGTATITVKTADGGFTATCAVTVTGGSVTPCDNPVTITLPFSQNGAGEYCFVTSQEPAYVNSWNMDKVTINNVDYTNKWSNSMPAAIDGKWYIYYKGSYAWSHFEAPAAKSTEQITRLNEIQVYPNPFEHEIFINLNGLEIVNRIEMYNTNGQLLKVIDSEQISSKIIKLENNYTGNVFIIRIYTPDLIMTKPVIRL